MFNLLFSLDDNQESVSYVTLDDGDVNPWKKPVSLKDALNDLSITNPATTFARKMKQGGFENIPENGVGEIAYFSDILSDLWIYTSERDETGKLDIRPYLSPMLLLNNAFCHIIQLRRIVDDYVSVYGPLKNNERL